MSNFPNNNCHTWPLCIHFIIAPQGGIPYAAYQHFMKKMR